MERQKFNDILYYIKTLYWALNPNEYFKRKTYENAILKQQDINVEFKYKPNENLILKLVDEISCIEILDCVHFTTESQKLQYFNELIQWVGKGWSTITEIENIDLQKNLDDFYSELLTEAYKVKKMFFDEEAILLSSLTKHAMVAQALFILWREENPESSGENNAKSIVNQYIGIYNQKHSDILEYSDAIRIGFRRMTEGQKIPATYRMTLLQFFSDSEEHLKILNVYSMP